MIADIVYDFRRLRGKDDPDRNEKWRMTKVEAFAIDSVKKAYAEGILPLSTAQRIAEMPTALQQAELNKSLNNPNIRSYKGRRRPISSKSTPKQPRRRRVAEDGLPDTPDLSEDERKAIQTKVLREAAERRQTEKNTRIAERRQRTAMLKTVQPPGKPVFMFGQQMWPIPPRSHASYSYDQLFFASNIFLDWRNMLHTKSPTDTAIWLRNLQKCLHLFVERRLSPGDDKSEIAGLLSVFEYLCDLYEKNPEGEVDKLFDLCLLREKGFD